MAIIGVASNCTQPVAYKDQVNNGILIHFIWLAFSRWMVVIKLIAVNIDEKPKIKAAAIVNETFVFVETLKGT